MSFYLETINMNENIHNIILEHFDKYGLPIGINILGNMLIDLKNPNAIMKIISKDENYLNNMIYFFEKLLIIFQNNYNIKYIKNNNDYKITRNNNIRLISFKKINL